MSACLTPHRCFKVYGEQDRTRAAPLTSTARTAQLLNTATGIQSTLHIIKSRIAESRIALANGEIMAAGLERLIKRGGPNEAGIEGVYTAERGPIVNERLRESRATQEYREARARASAPPTESKTNVVAEIRARLAAMDTRASVSPSTAELSRRAPVGSGLSHVEGSSVRARPVVLRSSSEQMALPSSPPSQWYTS